MFLYCFNRKCKLGPLPPNPTLTTRTRATTAATATITSPPPPRTTTISPPPSPPPPPTITTTTAAIQHFSCFYTPPEQPVIQVIPRPPVAVMEGASQQVICRSYAWPRPSYSWMTSKNVRLKAGSEVR